MCPVTVCSSRVCVWAPPVFLNPEVLELVSGTGKKTPGGADTDKCLCGKTHNLSFAKTSVESRYHIKVRTSHYHTKHRLALPGRVALSGLHVTHVRRGLLH